MTIPILIEEDLARLAVLAPDLDFADGERRAVLLESISRDVNAAPGSGKTTVLAAKLLLLGAKWTRRTNGICILSHTNVAREEIQRRLGENVSGSDLLGYPHFIGTIHALVNQFLAMPYIRSRGYKVDVVDDDVFSRRAVGIARSNWSLRTYMDKNASVAPMVAGLVYRGASLEVASEGGKLPGPESKTRAFILGIKQTLTEQGVFRYADMFAFAEHLLANSPHLKSRLSQRFPLVFIDEMQDTSWEQERLLSLMFDDTVIIQRFGDINQRILGNLEGADNLTFPAAGALPISTSKRFGPAIGRAVAAAQLAGTPVVGERADRFPPMLLTYSTENVGKVIAAFGIEVLNRFDDAALRAGTVKALSARKQGDAQKAVPGRTLLDYWPSFSDATKAGAPGAAQFWILVLGPIGADASDATLGERARDVRQAVLLVLRVVNADSVKEIKDPNQLLRRLAGAGFDVIPIQRLVRDIVVAPGGATTEAGRNQIIVLMFAALNKLLPLTMTLEVFAALPLFEELAAHIPELARKLCVVENAGRKIAIQVGSLASMKGETHLATLVLESYGHPSRRFDIEEALPVIAGLTVRDPALKDSHLSLYRNLYVGMSRPSSFLCLAANADRVTDKCKAALVDLGWVVEKVA